MKEPKYLMIKNDLKKSIELGEFLPGNKIYSEHELKEKYDASNTTVVRALQELVLEGYLTRIQGKGTFVSKGMLKKMVHFSEHNILQDSDNKNVEYEDSIKVLSIKKIKDPKIAKMIQLTANEEIIHFERIRLADNKPYAIQNNYIPAKYIPGIDLTKIERYESLSQELKNNYGINIFTNRFKETIKIKFPLDDSIKEKLNVQSDIPVYHFQRISYLASGEPFEFVETFTNYRYYSINIEA